MSDLPARILAEIDRIEQAAHLAINSLHPQEWDADLMKHPRGQYEARVNAGLNIKVTVETNPLSCDASDLARFIATNDPHTVLRRCAADRRILIAHRTKVFDKPVHFERLFSCEACHRFTDEGTSRWWCETVLALAEGYGITVDGAA